jgi:hypothetical protein
MPLPERHAITESAFVQMFRNLTGVPSYHYDAVFGRMVHEQFASARPAVVALELPASFRPALEWAAGCWPTPVAAFELGRQSAMGRVMPFVPGDSIFEAFRLASQAGIEVALIDVDVSVPSEQRPPPTLALDPEFAARVGEGFFDAADALNRRKQPLVSDLVREAAMASALAALMAQHVAVLWVGGFAHWARIVERLRCRDFAAPDTVPAPRRRFTRARLAPSALVRLTGQYPSMVAAFARAPQAFDPFDAMRLLLHEAATPEPDDQGTPPVSEARKMLPLEPAAAIDLARTGLYARNLAATARISEQPQLAELVLAASATIGPRYTARLFELATAEHLSTPGRALDTLTFEVDPHTRGSDQVEAGFCFRGQRLSAESWFPVPWPILDPPEAIQLTRVARDAHYEELPKARRGETFRWHAYPPDQEAYEGFVRYALRRASQLDRVDGPSVPFVSSLESGLDVRTTIRFWHEDQVYVRRYLQGSEFIRNGVIDWTSRAEDSETLRGGGGPAPGWNDPDSTAIGSVSRELGHETIGRQGQSEVTRRTREWSFVTLDHPTFETRSASGALWDRVIMPLVDLEKGRDDVYGWLELVFQFCEGKPFVYYSQYVPSARIYALARSHKVRLRWCPLGRLSATLLARHRFWHQLWLSDSQWRALLARLSGRGKPSRSAKGARRVGHHLAVPHPHKP